MNEMVFDICRVVATIIGLVLAYYVVPALKMLVKEHTDAELIDFIKACVYAAEQTLKNSDGSPNGAIKKKYVEERVAAWLKETGISISAEEIDILIESAVNAMNTGSN